VKVPDEAAQLEALEKQSREILARLTERGVNLDAQRDIELQFNAPDRARARKLADQLRRKGYRYVFLGSAHPRTGLVAVTVTVNEAPSTVGTPEHASRLVHLAARCGAVHEGWGTSS